jgi:hypothetical protein
VEEIEVRGGAVGKRNLIHIAHVYGSFVARARDPDYQAMGSGNLAVARQADN